MDQTVHVNLVDDDDEKDPLALDSSLEHSDCSDNAEQQSPLKHQQEVTAKPHTLRRHVPKIVVKPLHVEKKTTSPGNVAGTNTTNTINVQIPIPTNTSPTGRGSSSRRLQQQQQAKAAAAAAAAAAAVASSSNLACFTTALPTTTTAVTQASTMREVLASIPGFSVKPRRRSSKKMSTAAQIEQTKDGKIDLETPDSILASTNLRALLNKQTFSMLPPLYQYNLIQLLPSVDREAIEVEPENRTSDDTTSIQGIRLGASSLNNEFFNRACIEWRDRLAEGEFTPENQIKLKTEAEREKNKLDPWKLKHFEPIWGEKSANRASSTCSSDSNSSLSTKLKLEANWSSKIAAANETTTTATATATATTSANAVTSTLSSSSSSSLMTTTTTATATASTKQIKMEPDSFKSAARPSTSTSSNSNSSSSTSTTSSSTSSSSSSSNLSNKLAADEKLEFKLESKGGLTATIVKTSKSSPSFVVTGATPTSESLVANKDEVDNVKNEKLVKIESSSSSPTTTTLLNIQQAENFCDNQTDSKPDVDESTKCTKNSRLSFDNALRLQNQSQHENTTTAVNAVNDMMNKRGTKRPPISPSRSRKRNDQNNENISKQFKIDNLRPCEENVPNTTTISPTTIITTTNSNFITTLNSIRNLNTSSTISPSSCASPSIVSNSYTSSSSSASSTSSSSFAKMVPTFTITSVSSLAATSSSANTNTCSPSTFITSSTPITTAATKSIPLNNNSTCDNNTSTSSSSSSSSLYTTFASSSSSLTITPIPPSSSSFSSNKSSSSLITSSVAASHQQQQRHKPKQEEQIITSVIIDDDDDDDEQDDLDDDEEDDLNNTSDDVIITSVDDDDDPEILEQKFADAENYVLESGEVITSDSSDCIIISD